MQKSLYAVLLIITGALAVTNVLTFQAYLQANAKQAELLQWQAEKARELRDCQEDDRETLGAKAGLALGNLQATTQDSYLVLNEKAAKTSAELQKIASEAIVVINEQAEKTGKDLETATAELMATLNHELEKFRESMNKKTSPNP